MTGNDAFDQLVDEFLTNEFETSPVMASYHGKTEYDDRLDDMSAAAFHKRDTDAQEWFDRFEAAGDGPRPPTRRSTASSPWPRCAAE